MLRNRWPGTPETLNRPRSFHNHRTVADFIFASIVLGFAAAELGGLVTTPQVFGWCAGLVKPTWTPPDWIFGPAWTMLYLMMATAAWLVWFYEKRTSPATSLVVGLFIHTDQEATHAGAKAGGAVDGKRCLIFSSALQQTMT